MRRQAGSPRTSARSGRCAPGAHSLRGKPAEPLPPNSSQETVSIPESVQFSDPIWSAPLRVDRLRSPN